MTIRSADQFARTSISRATNTAKHSGVNNRDDWAERHLENTAFGVPPERPRAREQQTKRPELVARHEWHGAAYEMVTHQQRQEGDPTPHGVPPQYTHPMNLTGMIVGGAPRALPVTQAITHGPAQDRAKAFAQGSAEEFLLGNENFRDRRVDGRRYRGTWNGEGRQEPYDIESQTDHNTMDRLLMKTL
jgi:hypothetical protein